MLIQGMMVGLLWTVTNYLLTDDLDGGWLLCGAQAADSADGVHPLLHLGFAISFEVISATLRLDSEHGSTDLRIEWSVTITFHTQPGIHLQCKISITTTSRKMYMITYFLFLLLVPFDTETRVIFSKTKYLIT